MNMTIDKASKLIGGILAELEKDTDAIVTRVLIEDLDATLIESDRRQYLRHVRIETERVPGTCWVK